MDPQGGARKQKKGPESGRHDQQAQDKLPGLWQGPGKAGRSPEIPAQGSWNSSTPRWNCGETGSWTQLSESNPGASLPPEVWGPQGPSSKARDHSRPMQVPRRAPQRMWVDRVPPAPSARAGPEHPGTECSPVTGPVDPVHPILCPLSEPVLDDFTLNPGSWRGLGRKRHLLPPTAISKAAVLRLPCETNPAQSHDPS